MTYGKVRRGVVAAAVVALATASPAVAQVPDQPAPHAFKQAEFAEQPVVPERLTAAFHMTKEGQSPTRAFTSPGSMLADPSNPRVIVAATADLRTRVCHLLRSTDAGRTWQFSESLPAPDGYPHCTSNNAGVATASLAWGRNGTLYYGLQAYGEGEGFRNGKGSIALARTTDLGKTWSTTLIENNRGATDEPVPHAEGVTGVAVDTSGPRDVVYVGYTRRYRNAPQDSPLNNPHVFVATSSDGGATFGEPVNLNHFSRVTHTIEGQSYPLLMRSSFGAPFLVAHDGVVLAVTGSETPFDNEPPSPPEAGAGLRPGSYYAHPYPQLVARSTDQGRTWSVTKLGPPIYAGTGSQTGLGWTPKGGAEGTFVAAYAATPETATTTGMADIVFQRSTDDGKTWSEPVAIDDDDPGQHFTSFYPQLGVAPNGRIDVVWQDNRDLTDYRFNVRYAYSTDGGETWAPNLQINDRPVDFNLGVSFNSDLRYVPGVASANEYAAFGWADPRLADELTQTQDNFGAMAQFSPLPASSILPYVGAVFAGLVAAGIVLLVVVLLRRRRRQVSAPSGVQPREPVGAG